MGTQNGLDNGFGMPVHRKTSPEAVIKESMVSPSKFCRRFLLPPRRHGTVLWAFEHSSRMKSRSRALSLPGRSRHRSFVSTRCALLMCYLLMSVVAPGLAFILRGRERATRKLPASNRPAEECGNHTRKASPGSATPRFFSSWPICPGLSRKL